jgi:hypothetical protein
MIMTCNIHDNLCKTKAQMKAIGSNTELYHERSRIYELAMHQMTINEKTIQTKMRFRQIVDRVFNDDLMMTLASILAGVVVLQFLFDFSQGMIAVF